MKLLEPGTEIDGFVIEECLHAGGMAHIYRVRYAQPGREPGFPMAMKVPRMTAGDGAENIVGFEVEHQLLQVLTGPHVPRFVAAGDLARVPYLVMELVPGRPLQDWIDRASLERRQPPAAEIARLGAALAVAAHSLHQQDAVHLDIKPGNVIIRPDGRAVLLDFGLSWHGHYPDLLAEEMRLAVGSPPWIAPEQVVGVRGDPRSDVFAIGVVLYELATGELPFGDPQTRGGLRQRLWMDPPPPRAIAPATPPWLQEIILRCLEPEAAQRYASAAHLAFDLADPDQVQVGERGQRTRGTSWWTHVKRWFKAAGLHYHPSPLPSTQIDQVPIVMVAVPWRDASDATLYSLRRATGRSLGIRPGARLACVTVIGPGDTDSTDRQRSEVQVHRRQLEALRRWSQGLPLEGHQVSCHVLEASDVAAALVQYARGNNVSLMILGAATHGLKFQRLVGTVPIRVAMEAPCSVMLVKQALPFSELDRTPVPEALAPDPAQQERGEPAAPQRRASSLYMGPLE
ncbi:bifunctional serine/threonine-protein kinase/universal stress protein [Ramlibacter sp.]|uniref:serine/threonine protein kinase n=1 Tax=Ramlibacter sp. TaxID=1917967 RepID=UPI002C5D8014|nr:bifunctional serine/threonine-protein kinase/universal stress protein [Ramlibacter sp.]HWI80650.1 bifunctional serine/threonine-protein kinase/universal stress protein [Ramlibacter sp.]